MRRFHLHRVEDESGVSGVGIVAEGVIFESGKVAISWLTKYTSVGLYDSVEIMLHIHGHGGKTRLIMVDASEPDVAPADASPLPSAGDPS